MKCTYCGREISQENEQSFAEANFGRYFDCGDKPLNVDCLLSEHDLCNRWHVSRRYLADLRRRGVGPNPIPLSDLLFGYGLKSVRVYERDTGIKPDLEAEERYFAGLFPASNAP